MSLEQEGVRLTGIFACACFFAALACAQDVPQQYSERCAGCHGADAEGSDRAPKLSASRRLRTRTEKQIRATIHDGVPSAGMPAFALPATDLDALAAFVHSLNSAAAESKLPGSPASGETFFFGKGQCASCHMVRGMGRALGPDLSRTGQEMTVGEIRQVLAHPEARITPGYELVTVHPRNGAPLRGFARGRTNFDLQLQDLNGGFHLLKQTEIASIEAEKPLMKPTAGSPEELRDLVAYLGTLTGVAAHKSSTSPPPLPSTDAGVDFKRIETPHPGDWLTYNGNLDGNRYSPLSQISAANVSRLAVQWMFPIDHFGIETTPLVADGVMYVTGPNQAWALDALTGRPIWHYAYPRTQGLVGDASLGTNRGMAILGEKVLMVTDNAHLLALNRVTGSLVWETVMPEEPQHYGSTVAPLIVNDTVIAGVSGGDWGIRGFVAAFKTSTGELLWRHWNIPLKDEPGAETWKGSAPLYGGGSSWLTGAYDPETDTLYWPTGNPWPDSNDRDRPGDNLFTNCILALNPHTGARKWYFQFTPHDVHDWDATEPPLLVDTNYQGRDRKLLLHADRNGFFYVLDRTDGKLLLGKQFLRRLTWADGIASDGRPNLVSENKLPPDGMMCPTDGTNWGSAAFSPATRLMYVLTLEQCRQEKRASWHGGEVALPVPQKFLRAIDIDTGKIAWEIPQIGFVLPKTWPGVLATAGGLLFYGDPNGAFAAVSDRDGKPLWHFDTNVPMKASPMTFMAGGKQFIAVAAGPNIICFGL